MTALTSCHLCPRLVAWRQQVAGEKCRAYRHWDYWGRPVPGFGDPAARLLVVGLAPGAHGSNRTGRMFTGDASGDFLYSALYRAGFANQPTSISRDDGLSVLDVFITAVCRCAPPDNKPTPQEIATCLPYIQQEIALLPGIQVMVALGRIAFENILRLFGIRNPQYVFSHGALYSLSPASTFLASPLTLIASYHPSRQNTQTGRLTPVMFDAIWKMAKALLR